jgi:hypothetical protein
LVDLGGAGGDFALNLDMLGSPGADLTLVSYPSGPYGGSVGNVVPPLVWEGYVNLSADAVSTTKPYGAYSMDDVRKSGHPYALLHVSQFY